MRKSRFSVLVVSLFFSALICSLFQPAPLAAQERKGTVTGHVTDATHAVLQGARIELKPNGPTAVSDNEGQFVISGVVPGQYTLTVSYMGFGTFSKDMTVTAGQMASVDAVLQVEGKSETIEVRPEREVGEIGALNRERNAENILQVLPAEVITSLPNANIADA